MGGHINETDPSQFGPNWKYTPLRQSRILLVRFVQGLFAAQPKNSYRWDPDDSLSDILISNEMSLEEEVMNKRPAITFTRGPITFSPIGIGDIDSYDFTTGKVTKDTLVPGTMIANVVSRFPLECEDVAWIVAESLWIFRSLLMRAGFFDIGQRPNIGAPSPAGSIVADSELADQYTVVAVSIPFVFPRRASISPLNTTVVSSIEQSLSMVTSPVNALGAPREEVNIHECPPEPFSAASDAHGQTPDPAQIRQPALQRVQHPLDPSKTVTARRVYPQRAGANLRASLVPISDPCVKESPK